MNQRIDAFLNYFKTKNANSIHKYENYNYEHPLSHPNTKSWTNKTRIYQLVAGNEPHLIPIEYYPAVQFTAAYELDIINQIRKEHKLTIDYGYFDTVSPFDIGASVYDDINPVLAVLNNIICRGIPTKASPFVESVFAANFDLSKKAVNRFVIEYELNELINIDTLKSIFENGVDAKSSNELALVQHIFTPIAIARFQKVLVEAILTGHLEIESEKWEFLIEEKDVPFAYIAIEDFKVMYANLISLTQDFEHLVLPEIKLTVINASVYNTSKLHLDNAVYPKANQQFINKTYDLVFTLSLAKSNVYEIEDFSQYKVKNNCYFNSCTAINKKAKRYIYTTDLITYKNLVTKDQGGNYSDIIETKEKLEYFVQLLFRKVAFRPGQLPILDRAMQHKPVIGLLPTGGGKSLTYQVAAMLQPGVTMIIDPLKSLMKDQYDGLINIGIDSAGYLNSSQSSLEKKAVESQLENSQLQFIFLSPERLAIYSFRERLKHMHDYNVYFAYGVIDEVHCVSEWGHDFRFSYLHLGRNLYNYVRSKNKEISLYGLTATASFDVLADVERELSGNGAFVLDADTIVRYENTNRLELQYKIEKVPIEFDLDPYYDKNNKIDPSLPRALNISNSFVAFKSKSDFLKDYIEQVPHYFNQLIEDKNINLIKESFFDRQGNNIGIEEKLVTEMPNDYFSIKSKYDQAGIVFCPHVKKTGVSVIENKKNVIDKIQDVASFSGQDDDELSMSNLEKFRDNKSPLMIATKAFGMGIDKPNVRFTVNMNYSSSLESFVQEAGRAGRDKKMALATIFVSDYSLASIKRSYINYSSTISILKGKWFHESHLKQILNHYNLNIPDEYILIANPVQDIVKLKCIKDNRMFGFKECSEKCSEFKRCKLKDIPDESRGWKAEKELIEELRNANLNIGKKNFEYLNPDYGTVMYFFNESFKGDIAEKTFMHQLLNVKEVKVGEKERTTYNGFLAPLIGAEKNEDLVVYVSYTIFPNSGEDSNDFDRRQNGHMIDLSKAIYRMCCIELIKDFTQDYANNEFRILVNNKSEGGYYYGLQIFLQRYFTLDRAILEVQKAKAFEVKNEDDTDIVKEIYRCLAYLTSFVYDKISEKRKRAIDDMRNFCMLGLENPNNWIVSNEKLKDDLFYYFNSKYAKPDYILDDGTPFSLLIDTEEGKRSDTNTVFKYLRVIEDELVGTGTPLDNVRHLYGAVRLISRSLTDTNPTLYLLEVFCLAYLGTKNNDNLKNQLAQRYADGILDFSTRFNSQKEFWEFFELYNKQLETLLKVKKLKELKDNSTLQVHNNQINSILSNYLNNE
ncbi:DEAD/DEAH box helicase [Sphingobacterium daejeonense]